MAGIGRGLAAAMDPGAEMWSSADSYARHVAAMDRQAASRAARLNGPKQTRRQLALIRSRQDTPKPGDAVEVLIKAYRKDARIKLSRPKMERRTGAAGSKEIAGFSAQARRRLKFCMRNTSGMWTGFVTLTYPKNFTTDGRQVKRHLNAFLQFLRRKEIAFVWVLEFQKNGTPHFHIFTRGWLPKAQLSQAWFSIVGSGNRDHLTSGTQIKAIKDADKAEAYMGKYAAKSDSKQVPKKYTGVGRFWGASRCLSVAVSAEIRMTYAEAARALRDLRRRNAAEFREAGARGPGFRWRWGGAGFECRGGAGVVWKMFRHSVIRQTIRGAVLSDTGEAVRNATLAHGVAAVAGWVADRCGLPRPGVVLTPKAHAESRGQFTLAGGFEATHGGYDA